MKPLSKTSKKYLLSVVSILILVATYIAGFYSGRASGRVLSWKSGYWEYKQTLSRQDPVFIGTLSKSDIIIPGLGGDFIETPLGNYVYSMPTDQYSPYGWHPLEGACGLQGESLRNFDW